MFSGAHVLHRGGLVTDGERPGSNTTAHLVYDLAINRYAALKVKPETEERPTGTHRMLNVLLY